MTWLDSCEYACVGSAAVAHGQDRWLVWVRYLFECANANVQVNNLPAKVQWNIDHSGEARPHVKGAPTWGPPLTTAQNLLTSSCAERWSRDIWFETQGAAESNPRPSEASASLYRILRPLHIFQKPNRRLHLDHSSTVCDISLEHRLQLVQSKVKLPSSQAGDVDVLVVDRSQSPCNYIL